MTYVICHHCHMTYIENYIICQQWQMTYHMWQYGCLKNQCNSGMQPMAQSPFYKLFSALKVKKCKQLIILCIFGIFLCIIKWLGATLKTYFYQKIKIKYCSMDQNTNKSQPPKKIYDKWWFLNMSTANGKGSLSTVGGSPLAGF